MDSFSRATYDFRALPDTRASSQGAEDYRKIDLILTARVPSTGGSSDTLRLAIRNNASFTAYETLRLRARASAETVGNVDCRVRFRRCRESIAR
jgi:hypothetical protein